MKQVLNKFLPTVIIAILLFSCKKDLEVATKQSDIPPTVSLSPQSLVLLQSGQADTVETISWTNSEYGFSAAVNYTIQIAAAGTNFASAQEINVGSKTFFKLTGAYLNNIAITAGLATNVAGQLDVRVKSSLSSKLSIFSDKVTLTITPFKTAYPALLVQGGNGWTTPATRTNGYLVASPDYSSKYEGYVWLPDADGYSGDAFKLLSSTTGSIYTWNGNPVAGSDPSGNPNFTASITTNSGNLWIPHASGGVYMKLNVDISALTMSWMPIKFFITGDDNGWSTTATPMTFNPSTNKWVATNVTLTAGKAFAFTSNYGWDFNFRDDGSGNFIYGGPPGWAGVNIPVKASGTFTVTLDLSGGSGVYTYSIQ